MTLDAAFLHALDTIVPSRPGEALSRHTTIGIGGPADAYVAVETTDQLAAVVQLCRRAGIPFFVLGSGSNIVVGDRGIRGVVIENNATHLSEPIPMPRPSDRGTTPDATNLTDADPMPRVLTRGTEAMPGGSAPGTTPDRYLFRADSGCSFAATARQLAFAGYAGLEWACGIPGTIGGAVVYNAGAYGGCLGDVLQRIAIATEDGIEELPAFDLGLVYRGSAFTRGLMAGRAVLWAEFALWRADPDQLRARVADYDQRRIKAQPRGRNAGSFFKNPPGQPAWKLLEAVGLRGHRVGGAEFSDKHCNFLINAGGATAADVAALKSLAQQRVRDEFGLDLQNEVSLVGEGFGDG
ncbi:MAG: UDP-N-acetylmuramate dehydrogenase [Dehalococcoidia bacterium]|nr:UDP-N-acetylmuramate dehydrogenase [Dehalococcoidia bacterium]